MPIMMHRLPDKVTQHEAHEFMDDFDFRIKFKSTDNETVNKVLSFHAILVGMAVELCNLGTTMILH